MGKTKEGMTTFGGFESVFESLGHERTSTVPNLTPDVNIKDDDDNAEPVDLSLGKKKSQTENSIEDPNDLENVKDGDDGIPTVDLKSILNNEQQEEDNDRDSTQSDDNEPNENETGNVHSFFDAFAESLGWEVGTDEKPNSVEELVAYVQKTVEENSQPQYATEEIADLNEFVKNGGNIEEYIYGANEIKSYENLDITDEGNQKRIVKEYLQYTGLNENQISRKISKYEDAGLLEDEAEEALEYLQEVKAEEQKQLLVQQQKQAESHKAEQQKFYTNVVSEIESLKDIRGISIPKEDKKVLREYLFKVEGDGKTKYQKDYSKSVKNLIESAYFTMKGDTLIKSAQKTGETSAVKKLKNTLNSTKVGSSKHGMDDGAPAPVWSMSSFLRKPTN
jgi:hypothetical protein